jgi:hypothetical protein
MVAIMVMFLPAGVADAASRRTLLVVIVPELAAGILTQEISGCHSTSMARPV